MGAFNSKVSPASENSSDHKNADPRSPTLHINRSPIAQEGSAASRESITKAKDLTSVLMETSMVSLQTPAHMLPKRFQSIIDPRSPSTFTRTPLILGSEPVEDCSLTDVVSSLQYEECSIVQEEQDNVDDSFKDCDPQIADFCNLQIDYDESAPIIEPLMDANEESIFEDAEVTPFAGIDPRSPSIAIARTPMVLVEPDDAGENAKNRTAAQVEIVQGLEGNAKTEVEKQQRTPKQQITGGLDDQETPKKNKSAQSANRAGNRTPLGCVTNTGTPASHIRKMALIGQIKQSMAADEKKLLSRSAELNNSSAKQSNRSRIPKLRMS